MKGSSGVGKRIPLGAVYIECADAEFKSEEREIEIVGDIVRKDKAAAVKTSGSMHREKIVSQ